MTNTPQNILTVDDNEGQTLSVAGNIYRIIISGKQTGGSFAIIDMLVPPGGGPGPHAHPDLQESFYVVDGQVDFKSETGNYTAGKGSFISIPLNGPVHCFKNTTQTTAHLLCAVVPAGLEEFFRAVGKPVQDGIATPPDPLTPEEQESIKALAAQYGQMLYPPDYLD